jgi:ApaG protein
MREKAMSVATTQGIRVSVHTRFVETESSPRESQWVFTYQVTIENASTAPARLLARHWIIKDAFGGSQEVRGEGVVGQTPLIEPGDSFSYQSWCPLPTDCGFMHGSYLMQRSEGELFEAAVAPFAMAAPSALN